MTRWRASPGRVDAGAGLLAPQEMGEQPRFILFDIRLPRILMALLCGPCWGWPARRCRASPVTGWPTRG